MGTRYRYGPSRSFVYVVGAALAVQIWLALPGAPHASDTAQLERSIYDTLQPRIAISDIRCTRTASDAANCVATLPDASRERVRARLDARTGALRSLVVDSVPPVRL